MAALALAAFPAHAAVCGNGLIEFGEQCDDGGDNGTQNSCCSLICKPTTKKPDVIVGELLPPLRLGTLNGRTAYAVGTYSCNVGSCWLNWVPETPDHPVIGQNMFRLKDGRFEQLGQSWLKHGFAALAHDLCGTCVDPTDFTHLGVNCADPYEAGLNAGQNGLGPKSTVNPTTGVFQYPDPAIGTTGNVLFKRLQVRNTDLDPALNPGALYFLEGQYVTRDDAAAHNQANNASHRRVTVGPAPSFNLTFSGITQREQPAIHAWKLADPSVNETVIDVDGRFILSAHATPLPGGMYHYEYAVQNLTSHRGARSFTVPIPLGAMVTNLGFHDVDYHSGEPFDGSDWIPTVTGSAITWETSTFAVNPNANALRWGTLYNFRFDADVPPGLAVVSLAMFRTGTPSAVSRLTAAPSPCTQAPAEAGNLQLSQGGGTTTLVWTPAAGSTWSTVLRGGLAFLPVGPGGPGDEACVGETVLGDTISDAVNPQPGAGFWYLVQSRNSCGVGTWGFEGVNGSPGPIRLTSNCP